MNGAAAAGPTRPGWRAARAALLGLAMPGLGHVVLGRPRRGAAFFVLIVTTFVVGLALDGELVAPRPGRPLRMLGALAVAATGLPAFAARAFGLGAGDIRSATFEYGTTYLLTAGLMNALLVLDCADIALGTKR